MNKYYAQVVDNVVMNVISGDPTGRFDSSITWHECDVETKIGDIFIIDDNVVNDNTSNIEAKTLEEEKRITYNLVNLVYRTLFDKLTASYDEREVGTWFIQIAEALEYMVNGDSADISFLDQISKKRYIPKELLVKRVLGHNMIFRQMAGAITGDRQHFEDIISGCNNIKELHRIRKDIKRWLEEGSKIAV